MTSLIPTTYDQSSQPQQSFAEQYDLDNPEQSVSSYSKLIHQHTLRQMELASVSAKHQAGGNGSSPSLGSEESTESNDSVGSAQQ